MMSRGLPATRTKRCSCSQRRSRYPTTRCSPPVSSRLRRKAAGSAARYEGDDDVGGVTVEVLSASVVDRRRSRIGVAGGELHVSEGDAGIEGGHDERCSQHVRVHVAEPGAFADGSHPSLCGTPIEPLPVAAQQDRTFVAFTDGEIDRARGPRDQRDDGGLVAFADDAKRAVTPLECRDPSMFVAHASDTRSPLRPSRTASAAWARSKCSAVNRNLPSSPRSKACCSLGETLGRRTYWAGLETIRPSMCANR